jgi:hypothetical protein
MAKNPGLVALLAAAGPPISRAPMRLREAPPSVDRRRLLELEALLHLRDGFRAFGHALSVRPSVTVASVRSVDEWNALGLWRTPYRHATKLYFFADDVIGRQFALHEHEVVTFDPETGLFETFASDLDGWAARVVADPDDVGEMRVRAFEEEAGPLLPHERLQPTTPFSLVPPPQAAQSEPVELRRIHDVELMRRYARLFRESAASPTGTAADLSWWLADARTAAPP